MTVPTSIRIAVDRAAKKVRELTRYETKLSDRDKAEFEVEASELVVEQALLLDKVMNAIYEKFGDKQGNKPNIYFPNCQSQEALHTMLQKYRLKAIIQRCPELVEELAKCQPYTIGQNGWWPRLRALSSVRHERFNEIDQGSDTGSIAIGRGFTYIKELSTDAFGRISRLDGYQINQKTGLKEKLSIGFLKDRPASIGGIQVEPNEFVAECQREIDALIKRVYLYL